MLSPQKLNFHPTLNNTQNGFEVAIKTANLNVPTLNTSNFTIWQPFNLSMITDIEIKELKKSEPAPAIPIEQLGAQISSFRHINLETDQS